MDVLTPSETEIKFKKNNWIFQTFKRSNDSSEMERRNRMFWNFYRIYAKHIFIKYRVIVKSFRPSLFHLRTIKCVQEWKILLQNSITQYAYKDAVFQKLTRIFDFKPQICMFIMFISFTFGFDNDVCYPNIKFVFF